MHWTRDLPKWSLPELSSQIACGAHRWHVQQAGEGPMLLLLHGTGASTHSWRKIIPSLSETHHVVAVDLPGHGFTQSPRYGQRSGLDAMAADLTALAQQEGWKPAAIIGHSAGAAIALRMAQMGVSHQIIGLNPALRTFDGAAAWLFPIMAKAMALTPLLPRIFAARATLEGTERLIRNTGSTLDVEGIRFYTRLLSDREHVNGALQMMAAWSLNRLMDQLPEIKAEVLFLSGDNDRASPPHSVDQAAQKLANARVIHMPGLGHILQEEAPERVLSELRSAFNG